MRSWLQHIGFGLLAIFTVPVGYQTVHVLQYHTATSCDHHCEIDHHSNSSDESEDGYSTQRTERSHCPVVEFKFSIKDLPTLSSDNNVLFRVQGSLIFLSSTAFLEAHFSLQSPRAPPVMAVS